MKSKNIIYPIVIFLFLALPLVRYYVSTPELNDCMIKYVKEMKNSNYKGIIYNINGVAHIEAANSKNIKSLSKYKIGEAEGCIMTGDKIYANFANTIYCSVVDMIQKAPINNKLKKPFALLKTGKFSL